VSVLVAVHTALPRRPGRGLAEELSAGAGAAGRLLLFAVTAGVLAMAVVEAMKSLTPLRGLVHRTVIDRMLQWRWTSPSHEILDMVRGRSGTSARGGAVFGDTAWFDVPLGQLMAQLAALAERDIDALPSAATGGEPRFLSLLVDPIELASVGATDGSERDAAEAAETALRAVVEARLHRLNASLAYAWREVIRATSAVVAGGVGAVLLLTAGAGAGVVATGALACVFVGGPASWLARDLLGVAERWRR
jgi:hypothetical protein